MFLDSGGQFWVSKLDLKLKFASKTMLGLQNETRALYSVLSARDKEVSPRAE